MSKKQTIKSDAGTRRANRRRHHKPLRWLLAFAGLVVLGAAAVYIVDFPTEPEEPDYFVRFESQLADADIAGFNDACVTQVIERDTIPETCRSAAMIRQTYNLSPRAFITIQLGRMTDTARRIAYGDLMTAEAYESCLQRNECVEVPLIPARLRGQDNVASSPEAREISRLFWHLVNDGSLTPAVCEYMESCRAMLKIGILTTDNPVIGQGR